MCARTARNSTPDFPLPRPQDATPARSTNHARVTNTEGEKPIEVQRLTLRHATASAYDQAL